MNRQKKEGVNVTAKQFLKQAYRLDELILSNQEELMKLKEMSTSIGSFDYSKDRVQTSPSGDAPYTNQIIKIIELENEIQSEIDKMTELKKAIRNAINQVENPDEKLLLRNRYLNFKTWNEIGSEMHYSLRTIHRIHQSALDNFVVPTQWHTMT